MKRLFTAITLPDSALNALTALRPPTANGIRNARREQMHLTLCFLGNATVEPIAAAIHAVEAERFKLHIKGLGRFRMGRRKSVLWAAVQQDAGLMELQAQVTDRLADQGLRRDTRPYKPHITLARCGPKAPKEVIDAWLVQHRDTALEPIDVTEFHLYSSDLSSGTPVYTRETRVQLGSA